MFLDLMMSACRYICSYTQSQINIYFMHGYVHIVMYQYHIISCKRLTFYRQKRFETNLSMLVN